LPNEGRNKSKRLRRAGTVLKNFELPVGDSAIEIDIDTREDLRRHSHIAE